VAAISCVDRVWPAGHTLSTHHFFLAAPAAQQIYMHDICIRGMRQAQIIVKRLALRAERQLCLMIEARVVQAGLGSAWQLAFSAPSV
jgi:hypothetical protein